MCCTEYQDILSVFWNVIYICLFWHYTLLNSVVKQWDKDMDKIFLLNFCQWNSGDKLLPFLLCDNCLLPWLSGIALDSSPKGCEFESSLCHWEIDIYSGCIQYSVHKCAVSVPLGCTILCMFHIICIIYNCKVH